MSAKIKKLGKWGRKKVGKKFGNSIMKVIALSAVWILTGLWHGTGINYFIWGIYWGSIIIFSTIFEKEINALTNFLHVNTETLSWKVWQMIRTFALFGVGIMMTRVQTLKQIKIILHNIVFSFAPWMYFDGSMYEYGLDKADFHIVCISLVIVWGISYIQEKYGGVRQRIAGLNAPVRWLLYALSILAVMFIGIYGAEYDTTGFAYTNF